jgi:hypothetical protein
MSTDLIGYKNLSERQREEFEKSAGRKQQKNLFLTMMLLPVILIAAFQIAVFFTDNLGGRVGALIIAVVLSIILEIWFIVKAIRQRLQNDFEGEVIVKKIKRISDGDPNNGVTTIRYRHIMEFKTNIGKIIKKHWDQGFANASPQTWYGYLNVGDKVRFHAKMDYYEKYDKSGDSEIPCAKCRRFVDIGPGTCSECGAELIKP